MKKVLFVINTLGGAGAEKALLELLKRFPENEYEVLLYVLLAQGELIHQVPEQVKILNQSYSDASVLSKKGKHILNRQIFKRLFMRGAIFKNLGYMLKNMAEMLKKGKLYPDKLLWRVMADSAQVIDGHYDMAVAFLEGGSTYYIHDHIRGFFRNYPLLLLYPMYLNFASSNCLPHLPYIVRFIIFNLLLVPSTNPLL